MKIKILNIDKIKSQKELETINTKNLLRYYRAERKRFYQYVSSNTCECCGEPIWNLNPKLYEKELIIYNTWVEYLSNIKKILNKRENIPIRLNNML